MHDMHGLYVNDNQMGIKLIANKKEEAIEFIAKLKTLNSRKNGDGSSKEVSAKFNGEKAECAGLKKGPK